ncbi:5-methylcytosine restriction system specificity protein McrC [Ensifer sp. CCNWLY38]|uniref:5-methylcytosine restriction system specificity protein McrC n=1 Tax=unclassified Ensifer TaxID=2633371 RepID=UPI003FA5A816
MSTQFEVYIARMLERALSSGDLRVVSQGGRLYCLETEDRRGLFQTRPDILLKRGDTVVQVIDTKWKQYYCSNRRSQAGCVAIRRLSDDGI